jgi:hypothetical protein
VVVTVLLAAEARRRGSAVGRAGPDIRWAVAGGGGEEKTTAVDGRRGGECGFAAARWRAAAEAPSEPGEAGKGRGARLCDWIDSNHREQGIDAPSYDGAFRMRLSLLRECFAQPVQQVSS